MQSESQERRITYYQPRELLFLVTYQDDLDDAQIHKLFDWANSLALKDSAHLSRHRVLRFPATPQREYPDVQQTQTSPGIRYKSPKVVQRGPFALIFADVEFADDKKNETNSTALVELIRRLDDDRSKHLVPGLTVELVSPDWLTSGASETSGTGGPGGRPVPFRGAADTEEYEFHLPKGIEAICPEKELRGRGVAVAILDTAPCLHDLVAAYEHWQKVDPRLNRSDHHRLIQSLLRPDGPLHVHPASYDDLLRMRSVHLDEHEYSMTDHGLFVAGIIHTIAPSAELHLVEVLNPDGVGDLQSIAEGLDWVVQNLSQRPLVVNLSLILNIPLEERHRQDGLLITDRKSLERYGQPLEWMCDLLYALQSRVIAAAGNDGEERGNRPQARYPAAFDRIVGVGALPKLDDPPQAAGAASYSNLSDNPQIVGITTLGGEATEGVPRNERVTLEAEGVLGLYIGQFPPGPGSGHGPPNINNWAWWCGTSFAAPIISGVTAAVLGSMMAAATRSGMPTPTTEQAIRKLYEAQAIVTIEDEDVLFVKQG